MTTTKLFVGNLPGGTKSEDLLDIFEKYGSVTECDVIKNYAFVVRRCIFVHLHNVNVQVTMALKCILCFYSFSIRII